MASVLNSAKAADGVQARKDLGYSEVAFSYALAAALVDEDVIRLCKIPKGAVITKLLIFVPDLDSATGITINVGDVTDPNRYIAASTVGQAPGVIDTEDIIPAAFGFLYTADDYLVIEVETAPTTGATTGTISGVVGYTVDP